MIGIFFGARMSLNKDHDLSLLAMIVRLVNFIIFFILAYFNVVYILTGYEVYSKPDKG